MHKDRNVVVLGAGVAGIAAAYQLKQAGVEAVVYEQENTFGGLCNSFRIDGFTFDTFAHISFDPATRPWLEEKTEYFIHEPEALNFDKGRWLRHPVQNNLYGLPVEERVELISGFINRKKADHLEDYGQWLESTYGQCFARRYPFQYTRKYWTVEPDRLETKWVQGRMYEPSLEEVLRGAMTGETPGVHYSKTACYPKNGGFQSFLEPMARECRICYHKKVCEIDTVDQKITFQDGNVVSYDDLISTIPLPELCGVLDGLPAQVRQAADNLDYTTGVIVSLGFNRPRVSPSLWFYIYDEDILPSRVYAPEWKSPNNVPPGCSAIQAEIYFSAYRPLTEPLESIMEKGISQMLKLGLFKEEDIILKDVRMKKYANIMFTPEIYKSRESIHQYLNEKGILYAGRFGEWDYLWTGQSLLSGRKAAESCLEKKG